MTSSPLSPTFDCRKHIATTATATTNSSSCNNRTYHDHMNGLGCEISTTNHGIEGNTKNYYSSTSKRNDSFPTKLHYVLNEVEKDGLSDIVSWQPHGRCFVVRHKEKFTQTILPLWFRQSKFTSFQRQLNLYGFRRLTKGKDKGGYYHHFFLKEEPSLCDKIQRMPVKGKGKRRASATENEPNFYSFGFFPSPRQNISNSTTTSTTTGKCNHSDKPASLNKNGDQRCAFNPSSAFSSPSHSNNNMNNDRDNDDGMPVASVSTYIDGFAFNEDGATKKSMENYHFQQSYYDNTNNITNLYPYLSITSAHSSSLLLTSKYSQMFNFSTTTIRNDQQKGVRGYTSIGLEDKEKNRNTGSNITTSAAGTTRTGLVETQLPSSLHTELNFAGWK